MRKLGTYFPHRQYRDIIAGATSNSWRARDAVLANQLIIGLLVGALDLVDTLSSCLGTQSYEDRIVALAE